MSRPHELPDPDDRTPNDPSVICSRVAVLGVVNKDRDPEECAQNVTDAVRDEYAKKAELIGWDKVEWVGSQVVLTNKDVESASKKTQRLNRRKSDEERIARGLERHRNTIMELAKR